MFCIECGKENRQMIDDICIDCFLKNFQMVEISKNINVEICSHCNSRLEEGKWQESFLPEDEIIYRALERNIKISDLVENEEINLEIEQMKGTIAECYIEVVGDVYGVSINETHDTSVRILKTVCPTCSKIQSGYYESVIQFRADKREIKSEEYEKTNEIVEKTILKQSKVDKLAYCPHIAKLKEGYDYYIGSLKTGRKIAENLREEFGGTVKESPRLISEDKSTGKGLYRIWISVRIPEFETGDIVEYDNKIIQIKDIRKNRAIGYDIKSNKKYNLSLKNIEDINLLKKEDKIETTTILSISPKIIQILDPSDYSAVDLEMKDEFKNYSIGDEVKVIKINDYVYLID